MNIPILYRGLGATALLLLATCFLRAQETKIYVENASGTSDEEVLVSVRGIGLEHVVGIQFSLTWDTLALEFVGVTDIALGGTFEDNFNRRQVQQGRIGYLEFDSNLRGLMLPDSSRLFTLRLLPLRTVSLETPIEFTEIPVGYSFSDSLNQAVTTTLVPGVVIIQGSSSLTAMGEDDRFRVAPNPFSDFSRITLDLQYTSKATLELLDAGGRTLFRRPWSISSGTVNYELSAADFPADGTYIVRITTDREQLHRKVIFQRRRR
ncbi:T9SS type A sorting domain-containing protein [Neolewinella lacunae]|uniref:T9SS type A sorting domain-containing protein n=1 Tax=Neolewinella lacunae TaxID=1517758 RepID=A0A923PND2_9BACT|nr:T9SS type A sorting domain-containing protein [Neolewinella lacunae]MBC6995600.1 T9SS type A sorting domain-containing protein [Neolewinella lacunae]MDN3635636.1 T9SS type A sorting domain-containing protein [Neolewinella lacunae]